MPLSRLLRDPLSYAWVPGFLLSRLRGGLIRLRHARNPRVRIGPGLIAEGPIQICGAGRVEIGAGVKVRRSNTYPVSIRTLASEACVRIGDGSELGGVQILCGREVSLGANTLAANCRIQDVDFAAPDVDLAPAPVRVGQGVWIGIASLLLKGCALGDWAIVAAGSVVEGAAPGLSLAMGNPARSIQGVVCKVVT